MKRDLLSIAMGLSEKEIKELVRIRKDGGKKLTELRRERGKLLAALAKIDAGIAAYGGSAAEEKTAPAKRGRKKRSTGRKPGRKPAAKEKSVKTAARKGAARKTGRRGRPAQTGLTEAVRQVVLNASGPVRASDVVDALPGQGYKVGDVAATRKRVSIVLATQKKNFRQAGRGLYALAE